MIDCWLSFSSFLWRKDMFMWMFGCSPSSVLISFSCSILEHDTNVCRTNLRRKMCSPHLAGISLISLISLLFFSFLEWATSLGTSSKRGLTETWGCKSNSHGGQTNLRVKLWAAKAFQLPHSKINTLHKMFHGPEVPQRETTHELKPSWMEGKTFYLLGRHSSWKNKSSSCRRANELYLAEKAYFIRIRKTLCLGTKHIENEFQMACKHYLHFSIIELGVWKHQKGNDLTCSAQWLPTVWKFLTAVSLG